MSFERAAAASRMIDREIDEIAARIIETTGCSLPAALIKARAVVERRRSANQTPLGQLAELAKQNRK